MADMTPKEITEDAILELINHVMMEFKPADTVDPSSSLTPTCSAVYKAIQQYAVGVPVTVNLDDNSKFRKFYTLDNSFIYKAGGKEYIDVSFVPKTMVNHNDWDNFSYIPTFNGVRYTIPVVTAKKSDYDVGYLTFAQPTAVRLRWERFFTDEDEFRYIQGIMSWFDRDIFIFKDTEHNNRLTMFCRPLWKSQITSAKEMYGSTLENRGPFPMDGGNMRISLQRSDWEADNFILKSLLVFRHA